MRRGFSVGLVLVMMALLLMMSLAAHAEGLVAAPAGVVAGDGVGLGQADLRGPEGAAIVAGERVIALAPVRSLEEEGLLDLHRAATTKTVSLQNYRLEYGPVVANAGAGGAVSWLVAASAKRKAWVDVGALKTDADWHGLLGISTNCPVGGQRVQARTAIGVGILTNGTKIGYTRVRLRF